MSEGRRHSKSTGRKKLLKAKPLDEVREKRLPVAKPLSDTEIFRLQQSHGDTTIQQRKQPAHEQPATADAATDADGLPVIDTTVPRRQKQASWRFALAALVPYFNLPVTASWAGSLVVHAVVFSGCLLVFVPTKEPPAEEIVIEPEIEEPEEVFYLDQVVQTNEFIDGLDVELPDVVELTPEETVESNFNDLDAGISSSAPNVPPVADMMQEVETLLANGLGRTSDPWSAASGGLGVEGDGLNAGVRYVLRRGAEGNGATKESEQAVEQALQWLARQQLSDGSWNFAHTGAAGEAADPHAGSLTQAHNAATGLALLPFLGAGHSHLQGEHQATVARGLAFLLGNIKAKGNVGSFHEPGGRMYSHGIATLAVCEAYAMSLNLPKTSIGKKTRAQRKAEEIAAIASAELATAAQLGINGIAYAQGPGGGWRYEPRQAGDMSVVGWQLMALKSGRMSGLYVDPSTVAGAMNFLDFVERDGGADYGYLNDEQGSSATRAIGLLSRMYLGWQPEYPPLERGIKELQRIGPSRNDLYYSYYATQVMYHHGGEVWNRWNPQMRDSLVSSQVGGGEYAGSWVAADPHGAKAGGRLYATAMSTMTLEIYYRYLPLYGQTGIEE